MHPAIKVATEEYKAVEVTLISDIDLKNMKKYVSLCCIYMCVCERERGKIGVYQRAREERGTCLKKEGEFVSLFVCFAFTLRVSLWLFFSYTDLFVSFLFTGD